MSARVLVNLTWLVPGVVGGSEEATTDALRAVREVGSDDLEVHLAVLEPFLTAHPDLVDAFEVHVLDLRGGSRAARVLAEQTWLASRTRRLGAEVVHHAGGVVPLVHPGRVVLTVHDLQPLDLPGNFSAVKRTYIRAMAGRSARTAAVVCTPSEFVRRRVVDLLHVPSERVVVVPWSTRFATHLEPAGATATTSSSEVFFLYPATTHPHKNHLVLLEAFALVAAEVPDVRLVLPGREGPCEDAVRARIAALGLADRVDRTGRVPRDRIEQLYRDAVATLVPSRYEGFGLPALEAMARRCPVVVSGSGSLAEVSRPEDRVDPDDVTGWAEAMHAVLDLTPAERSERAEAGVRLAERFTPQLTATRLLDAYRLAAP